MRCGICKFQNKSKLELPCLECTSNRAMDYFKPQTNADRIRNMTDEELAEFLKTDVEICEEMGEKHNCQIGCKDCILQWLQAEVKEGVIDECS